MANEKTEKILTNALRTSGVQDAEKKAELMLSYMKLVLKQNEVMNLTAITDEDEFIEKHLLDSLAVIGRPELESARRIADVGTGAGFPGAPLAIAYPDKGFLLIDSLRKRTDFITTACAELGIANVQTLHARAEEAAINPPLRESFDLVVCRAVGRLAVLCEYCLPLARVGGAVYAYKSESQTKEAKESAKALSTLGASTEVEIIPTNESPKPTPMNPVHERSLSTPSSQTKEPKTAQSSRHIIMIINKESQTPTKYPRRPGAPTKSPL
jgi:16S rRNA (guanine527-N7)-methyltransferase